MDRKNVDIVLVRMDKIGDLVVSLPVDEHPVFAGRSVHWLISKGLSFVTEQSTPKRSATEFKRSFSPFEMMRLVRWLRAHQPRTIVLLHCPWWVSMAAWLAGVPERLGRRSQWHSFLFVNLPVRQSRSKSDRHESDFNFDLVEWGFSRLGLRRTSGLPILKKTYLRMTAPNPFGTVEARGLRSKEYRVVHPGMGGSALNWPPENFVELITQLAKEMPVVITGTDADRKYLEKIKSVAELPNVRWLVGELKVFELLDILSQANSVIAPSTGVLHLAAALGTPVVGIYSPRRVEHPRRWGPKGMYTSALVPPVQDGDSFSPSVMTQVKVEDVLDAVTTVERRNATHPATASAPV